MCSSDLKLPGKDGKIWDRMLAWERGLTPAQRQALSQAVREAFDVQFEIRSATQKHTVLTAFIENAAENKNHQAAIKKLRAAKSNFPTTMVMREASKPRPFTLRRAENSGTSDV